MKTCSLLAVDDTRDNLFLLEQLLANYLPECELVTAGTGQEGLELAAGRAFDGALIDVQMPGMDGIELCRRLKSQDATRRLPILLITAKSSTPRMRAEGLEAGADDFISRPIDNTEFVAKIRVMLRIKDAEKALYAATQEMERRVLERTADLEAANRQLRTEIAERARTEAAIQRALEQACARDAETSALLEALRAVLEKGTFESAASTIFESCKRLLGATCGYISLAVPEGTHNVVVHVDSGRMPCTVDPGLPMPIRGLRAQAFETGRVVYENSFPAHAAAALLPDGHAPLANVLFAPLTVEGRVVGLLGLGNKPGGFDENDARMAAAFGESASIALSNSRTRESLEASERRFRSVVETASDAIVYTDEAGRIVFCNPATTRVFGYEGPELAGSALSSLIPERFRPAHEKGLRRFLSTRESKLLGRSIELVGRRKDGSEFPMELSIAAWSAEGRQFFTGVIRDITARKQVEEALRRAHHELEDRVRERTAELVSANARMQEQISERRRAEQALRETNALLERVFATTQVLLAYIDTGFNYIRVNRAYAEYNGRTPESFVGRNHFELYPSPDHDAIFRRVVQGGEAVSFYGKPFAWAGPPEPGPAFWDWSLHPVKNDSGQVEGLLLCLVDVTKREVAEARARQHQAQLAHVSRLSTMGEMGSSIAHELNQPLCAILASAQASLRLLRAAGVRDGAALDAIEQVTSQAKRAGDIVRHLRDFSRRRAFHRSTINMADVVRDAAGVVSTEARPLQVRINLDVKENPPAVLGDTIQLEQVLVNLLRNGIEAMDKTDPELRSLEVQLKTAAPDQIEVSIRDHGRGLPDGDPECIFEPFFTTKPEGMGIGLAISRSIVELHGGRLWATPCSDGGTTLRFILPAGRPRDGQGHGRASTEDS
jgi:PAS domain S-box-containing protein